MTIVLKLTFKTLAIVMLVKNNLQPCAFPLSKSTWNYKNRFNCVSYFGGDAFSCDIEDNNGVIFYVFFSLPNMSRQEDGHVLCCDESFDSVLYGL